MISSLKPFNIIQKNVSYIHIDKTIEWSIILITGELRFCILIMYNIAVTIGNIITAFYHKSFKLCDSEVRLNILKYLLLEFVLYG